MTLTVTCLPNASNPIVYRNAPVREVNIGPGGTFQIGTTMFSVIDAEVADPSASGVEETSFDRNELRNFEFRDAGMQMEMLATLPRIIDETPSDEDFAAKLVELLLEAIPRADAAAVVVYDIPEETSGGTESGSGTMANMVGSMAVATEKPSMIRVATRDEYSGRFRPSRRLIMSALDRRESIVHLWGQTDSDDEGDDDGPQFMVSDDLDWAFSTPILSDSCRGWCLYVSGITGEGEDDLGSDLRFAELMAQFIGSIRQVRTLQDQQTQLSSFFSPKIVESLTGEEAHMALIPSERDITVLFCDVRGFSRKSEQYQDDLHMLLTCVKEALAIMTNVILDADGTIADFQGDAALGFWGWPVTLENGEVPSCLAALLIHNEFKNPDAHGGLIDGFSVGIGVAHGNAISGQIGTSKQAKIGVFGPVVNQGSRLEGMTKQFGVPICIDEASANFVREHMPASQGRVRRLARVRPKGMAIALEVSELLTPANAPDAISDEIVETHENAVQAVIDGRWSEAIEILNGMPDADPKSFLLEHMGDTNNEPPEGWDGAFSLTKKETAKFAGFSEARLLAKAGLLKMWHRAPFRRRPANKYPLRFRIRSFYYKMGDFPILNRQLLHPQKAPSRSPFGDIPCGQIWSAVSSFPGVSSGRSSPKSKDPDRSPQLDSSVSPQGCRYQIGRQCP